MTVKLIAVDMDGTFLKSDKTYNVARFNQQYEALKAKGIRFVIASGNEYQHLTEDFPTLKDELVFIAENGAHIVTQGKTIYKNVIPNNLANEVADILAKQYPEVQTIYSGVKEAYVLKTVTPEYLKTSQYYYSKLIPVDNFYNLPDEIVKIGAVFPDHRTDSHLEDLQTKLKDRLNPTPSGFDAIDIIMKGESKARGIERLQKIWDIPTDQVVAFGDSGNDVAMLKHAGFGVVMENGNKVARNAANYTTETNDEEGVLNAIDRILAKEPLAPLK